MDITLVKFRYDEYGSHNHVAEVMLSDQYDRQRRWKIIDLLEEIGIDYMDYIIFSDDQRYACRRGKYEVWLKHEEDLMALKLVLI